MLGKKHTEKTKARMRQSALKNRASQLINLSKGWGWNKGLKGFGSFNKGKTRTPEMRKHLSDLAKERLRNPENHPAWKGGRKKHASGYIQIKMHNHPRANPSGYVLEHIVVWEKAHGQRLPSDMSIHHLNGIKDDNRPENLIALPKRRHSNKTQFEPYEKRILELEALVENLMKQIGWPDKIQEYPSQ